MLFYLRLILLLVFIVWQQYSFAQDSMSVGTIRCGNKALLGKWQLSKTLSMGTYHIVKKEDFDDILQLKPHHQFTEEVFYEGNHWILQGSWHINRRKATLAFTQRTYTLGKPEEHPKDIILQIIQADKKILAGKSTEKGRPVEVYYTRIP